MIGKGDLFPSLFFWFLFIVSVLVYPAVDKLIDSARCPAYGTGSETVRHFLLHCPGYVHDRWALERSLSRREKALTLENLLGDAEAIIPLTNFINESHQFTHPYPSIPYVKDRTMDRRSQGRSQVRIPQKLDRDQYLKGRPPHSRPQRTRRGTYRYARNRPSLASHDDGSTTTYRPTFSLMIGFKAQYMLYR